MKLLKEGEYYINILEHVLTKVGNDEDFSEMINDFSKFNYLEIDPSGDVISLVRVKNDEFIFTCYPKATDRVITLKEVLNIKNISEEFYGGKSMNEERELTLGERIEQLEKEKKALQEQIKNQKKYDEMRKASDDVALAMKALQDSGFSRTEAMQLFSIIMAGNMMISPFLRI